MGDAGLVELASPASAERPDPACPPSKVFTQGSGVAAVALARG